MKIIWENSKALCPHCHNEISSSSVMDIMREGGECAICGKYIERDDDEK